MRTAHDVATEVCNKYGVTLSQLRGQNRTWEFVRPRQELMWKLYKGLGRRHGRLTLKWIGEYLNRDHTTVLHGIRAYEGRTTAKFVSDWDPFGFSTVFMERKG